MLHMCAFKICPSMVTAASIRKTSNNPATSPLIKMLRYIKPKVDFICSIWNTFRQFRLLRCNLYLCLSFSGLIEAIFLLFFTASLDTTLTSASLDPIHDASRNELTFY